VTVVKLKAIWSMASSIDQAWLQASNVNGDTDTGQFVYGIREGTVKHGPHGSRKRKLASESHMCSISGSVNRVVIVLSCWRSQRMPVERRVNISSYASNLKDKP
jgi:hypothetical protein